MLRVEYEKFSDERLGEPSAAVRTFFVRRSSLLAGWGIASPALAAGASTGRKSF
jgi:hypothetical protein